MKKCFFSFAVLLTFNTASHASTFPTNLEGQYFCNCTEVGTNKTYKAIMSVKKTDQTYTINSKFDDGSFYIGTGIYNQEKHIFSIVFLNPKKSEETGIGVADVKNNYTMTSTWTYLNKTTLAHGTCIKSV